MRLTMLHFSTTSRSIYLLLLLLAARLYVVRPKHHVMFFRLTPTHPFDLTSERPLRPPRHVFALQVYREPLAVCGSMYFYNIRSLFSRCCVFFAAASTDVCVGRVQPLQDSPGERQQGECGGDGQGRPSLSPHLENIHFYYKFASTCTI